MSYTSTQGTSTLARPGDPLLPGDALEEIDTTLYHFESLFRVIEGLGSACQLGARTDGIDPEPFHALFGWIANELHDARLGLEVVNKYLLQS